MIALKAQNLKKAFGDLVAVDHLSLEIEQGEIFGFLGPNGAGKTTCIKMITGLLAPDSGEVEIGGKNGNERTHRHQVGFCPQEIVLWNNLTCYEQLTFMAAMYCIPQKVSGKRADDFLEIMGLTEKRNKLAKTLSGGMLRRMNILMALMHDPPILILDEPETGLDPQSRVMVREFIHSLAKTKTVIFTTHNMDEADRLCDRVGIIDHGKMLVTDTPESLKREIGIGDLLEITIAHNLAQREDLAGLADEVTLDGLVLLFRSKAIVGRIPRILEKLQSLSIPVTGIHLHENTLEDVFISLTGRKLREQS
jgi:ABC-2 type transport system ATP-binding protein